MSRSRSQEGVSAYTSRSPSSTALPSLSPSHSLHRDLSPTAADDGSHERSPLLADLVTRQLSRSRSRNIEDLPGDDDDRASAPVDLAGGDVDPSDDRASKPAAHQGLEGGRGERSRRRINTLKQRSKYYIPVLSWLPTYNLQLLAGDLVAGVTLACLLIPQGISYASQLGHLAPISGLYCAAVPAMIYALLGTCPQLSIGPEAALSLLVGNTITEIISDMDRDPHHPFSAAHKARIGVEVATGLGLQVGIITFALGLFRLGFLDVVLSRALLRGFITAVGCVICVEQMIGMLGLSSYLAAQPHPPSTTPEKFAFLLSHLEHTRKLTAVLAFSTLLFLILARMAKKKLKTRKSLAWIKFLPEILIAVVVTTFLAGRFRWDQQGLLVLGKIEGLGGDQGFIGFPLNAGTLRHFTTTLPTAFVIAVIGFVDSIVAAKENSGKYGYSMSPNRELVALGASNIASSFFPGLVPAYGSITRSRLNGDFGARTQMSGLFTSLSIWIAIAFLLPSLYFLPKCVLSAIVLLVVWGILIEAPHDIGYYIKVRAWQDFAQMLGTFLLTLFIGVETGLVASVAFSLVLVVQTSTGTKIKILGHVPGEDEWVPVDENPLAEEDVPGVLVVRIREDLNFANTGQLKERLRRLELYGPTKSHPSDAPRRDEVAVVVFHMSDVESIDASAAAIFYELSEAYTARNVSLFFTHLRPAQKELFDKIGLVTLLGRDHFQDDVTKALAIIESHGLGSTISLR